MNHKVLFGGALVAVLFGVWSCAPSSPEVAAPARSTAPAPPAVPVKTVAQEAEEARERRAAALAKARPAEKRFKAALRKLDPAGSLFAEVAVREEYPAQMLLLVTPGWDAAPKAQRMWAAEVIWKMWADANAENVSNPDQSRISLVVPSGREVGGSRVWAGSMIWVDDD